MYVLIFCTTLAHCECTPTTHYYVHVYVDLVYGILYIFAPRKYFIFFFFYMDTLGIPFTFVYFIIYVNICPESVSGATVRI